MAPPGPGLRPAGNGLFSDGPAPFRPTGGRGWHVGLRGLVLCTGLALGGCFSRAVYVSGLEATPRAQHESWEHYLFYGAIALSDPVDLRRVCPMGVARVESEVTVVNGIFHLLTLTLYCPSTVRVYCHRPARP